MYLSTEAAQQTCVYLERQDPDLLDRIGAATLRLEFPGYTGTATLCRIGRDGYNRELTVIATSRRHLFSWWGLPEENERARPPLEDYRTKEVLRDFIDACRLEYGGGRSAQIHNLAGFGSDWRNDLLLLLSYDSRLLAFTRRHGFYGDAEKIRRYRLFLAGQDGRGGIDGAHFRCLQSGFGITENGAIGRFRCRLVDLMVSRAQWVTFPNGVIHENGLLCSASDRDTATTGDEGGPIYALAEYEGEPTRCYLLGFTLGVNGTAVSSPAGTAGAIGDGIGRLGRGPARGRAGAALLTSGATAATPVAEPSATAVAQLPAETIGTREPARFGSVPTVVNNVATAVRDVLDRSYMTYDHAT